MNEYSQVVLYNGPASVLSLRILLPTPKSIGVKKDNIIFIYWEPSVTVPYIHKIKFTKQFGKIYTPSRQWTEKLGGVYFYWPQTILTEEIENFHSWEKRSKRGIMVLGNKFSAGKGQNYSLRRQIAQEKITEKQYLIDVYGSQWNKGVLYDFRHYIGNLRKTALKNIDLKSGNSLGIKHKNYFGEVSNKTETAKKYKINLVIENSPEYVSEKLFEAHLSQNIVLYVGAPLITENFDQNIAIQCDPSNTNIRNTVLRIMNLSDRDQYKIMRSQYLIAKKEAKKRFNKKVFQALAKDIINGVSS